ncbi:endolytic transglycosylase MltG [Flavobacterium sp.]|uniref:endolytic transglycosylase MltG n=1 Tax=Flavobacterium sp. TaxID=239 RepID=UPI0025BF1052|nr:endolytic transglycosylase MltG [Flavobacterium sp.]
MKKIIIKIVVGVLLVGVLLGGYLINKIFTSNTKFDQEEVYVYIPTGSNYEAVKKIIAPYVENLDKVDWVASKRGYTENVKSGKFLLKKGMSSFSIVRSLRLPVPVKLAFNNQESVDKLFERIASQVEPSVAELKAVFENEVFLKEHQLTKETLLTYFIPNTYEFYWDVSAEDLAKKFEKEYQRFWSNGRAEKAKGLNMTPAEVYTLASIVHKETAQAAERPRVAGVYLNRLKANMPLQADPTVIYAVKRESGDWNQQIKVVTFNDLKVNSPYNTYRIKGLPPGPIFMPDVSAIDAVLNPEKHNYLYFCASVEKFGYHEFAASYEEHLVIAKKYSEWVSKQGYKR